MSEISQIDCGYLAVVQAMAADRWKNAANRKDYIANVQSALSLLKNQAGINLIELKDPGKERKVSLEWPVKCNIEADECSTDICTITGTDVTPECKEYEVQCIKSTSFVVKDFAYRERTTSQQQALADNFNRHLKVLDDEVNAQILAGLNANGGVNAYTKSPGTVVGDKTFILPTSWNEHLFSYLAIVASKNKFSSPVILDGDNLFRLWFEIQKDAGNTDGKGALSKLLSFGDFYFDLANIVDDYDGQTFIFDAGAAAFISKAWYPAGAANAIRKQGTDMLYSIPSNNIPDISYDVIVREVCSNNDYETQVLITLNGLFATNPLGCDENNTGILLLECGSST